jgi:iron complex transport system substrate-binding protein
MIGFLTPRRRIVAECTLAIALTVGPFLLPSVGGSAFLTKAQAQATDAAIPAAAVDASRVVTIGSSLTEIVYALGAGDQVVARDSTSTYPPQAMDLPDVGYIRALSPEGVLSVDPSVILALEGSGPPETVSVLQTASLPFVEIAEEYSVEGVAAKIRNVGAVLGRSDEADALIADIERQMASLADQLPQSAPRVLFILSMQDGRIMASGRDTAADAMIALAGGVNAVSAFSGYKQMSGEAILAAMPQVIVMMDRTGDHAIADDALFAHPAIASTPAGRARAVARMDGSLLLGFGPRIGQATQQLAEAVAAAIGPAQ